MSGRVPSLSRREVLALSALVAAGCHRPVAEASPEGPMSQPPNSTPTPEAAAVPSSSILPVAFLGHGSPMNAIEMTPWSESWRALGAQLPTPRAILCVSAHWYVNGTYVTGNPTPRTIHDFGGFPQPLFDVQYPARGDARLAERISALLETWEAAPRTDWGLDHGTWSVLVHMRPAADVPVLQLSIDRRLAPHEHVAIGRALQQLRHEGVLVMGSGNVTHNLRHAMSTRETATPDWAATFDADVVRALEQHDGAALARMVETDAGRLSHPTPDHYYPLLYVAGAMMAEDAVSYPSAGFSHASLSMRSVLAG